MDHITTGHDATLLQLQYVTESLGMRRTYLKDNTRVEYKTPNDVVVELGHLIKPIATRNARTVQRPDIEWHPSYTTYQARVARLAQSAHHRPSSVPRGFPDQIVSPRVWTGSEFADPNKYLVHLSPEDVDEVKAALNHFKGLDGDHGPDAISKETFPLPNLGERLHAVAHNIHRGTGFNVVRGLNPTDFTPLDNVFVYLGITSYIAGIRGVQDFDGRMIVHIKDIEKDIPESTGRPSPYTSRAQPFHNDMCDILSMYAIDTALLGGESLLASSATVYNEIAATRPDLIHLLADDKWIFDDFGKTKPTWTNRPLLYNFRDHGPGFCYSRRPLTGAPFSPHHPEVPAMTEEQAEAIDAVQFTAAKHQLAIPLQAGDIEIFNNMALLHARNGFVDVADKECVNGCELRKSTINNTRHMLRLWLQSADEDLVWERPEPLQKSAFDVYGDSEARKIGKWDVHRAPPINRVLEKHFQCS